MNSFWIGKAVHSKMEFLELLRGGGGGGGGGGSNFEPHRLKSHIWKNMGLFWSKLVSGHIQLFSEVKRTP